MIPQNIVRGASDDNAASVFRNAADYAVLSGDRLLNDVRAEIQIVEDFRGICVDVRYEFAVEPAFLGGFGVLRPLLRVFARHVCVYSDSGADRKRDYNELHRIYDRERRQRIV